MGKSLTDKAIQDAAADLGVEPAVIRAVDEVESRGEGFTDDGHVKILFERHKFHQFTKGKYNASHPDISNKEAGGYGSSKSQYGRFSRAFELDPEAAMKSASWGRYQIMGFNHKAAGFNTVGEFVDAMKVSEDEQLKAFVKVIKAWGLAPELRMKDWAAFASQYNGAAYKKNKYDIKLAAAYNSFKDEAFVRDEPTEPPDPNNGITTGDNGDTPTPEEKPEDKKPQVETVSSNPPVVEVKSTGVSWLTKISAAIAPVTTFFTGVGLKIGGIVVTRDVLIIFMVCLTVSFAIGAWVYNRGKDREQERLKWSMDNLATEGKGNVIAKGST